MKVAAVAASFALLTFALRMLALVGFPNDEFMSLTPGAQMLMGELPLRDFADAGAPLTLAASAAAQAIGGRTLLSEAVLVAAAFAIAAAITVVVVREWTGSLALAAWAAAVEVLAFPRPYSYPKILLYVAEFGVLLVYARRPGWRSRIALAAMVAVAFLFRHDHGLYTGAAALVVLLVVHAPQGLVPAARALASWAAVLTLVLLPYVVYVQMYAGLREYIAAGIMVSRIEAARTMLDWPMPSLDWEPEHHAVLLLYAFWLLAAAATVIVLRDVRRRPTWQLAGAAAAIVLAVCVNAGFLRDPLDARIPDAIVPAVLLMAWLCGRATALRPRHATAAAACMVLMLCGTVAVASVGRFGEQLDRTEIKHGLAGVHGRTHEVIGQLRAPYVEEQMPSDFSFSLVPFYEYLQSCTDTRARLFVTGFAPEVAYFARRPFAGGHVVLYAGFNSSDADQRLTIDRLEKQQAPFVIVPPDRLDEFRRLYPHVAGYVSSHYERLTEVPVEGFDTPAAIFVRRGLSAVRAYGPDRWPCFR